MSVTLDLCLMLAVVTASPGDDIVRAVVANGHRKVGVIPMVIQTNGEKQSTIGPLGPRAKTMAKGVYDKLVSASRDGKFAKKYNVIPDKVMSRALKSRGITVDDLGDPEKLKALASSTGGMDGMVILTFDDEDNQTDSSVTSVEQGEKPNNDLGSGSSSKKIEGEIQDPSEVTTTYSDQFSDLGTLSKLAYEGRSWWLRRWDGETIVNIGLDIEGSDAFGQGSSWEHVQAEKLKPNLEHPATVVDFPFSFDVFVGGKSPRTGRDQRSPGCRIESWGRVQSSCGQSQFTRRLYRFVHRRCEFD